MPRKEFKLSFSKPLIMGILNVTPDSFSDGGKFLHVDQAVAHAEQMVREGADIIDIGGESSRPGSEPVCQAEELRRVIPVIEALAQKISLPLSIDTYKSGVAQRAVEAGARMINDITGLRDHQMIKVAAQYQVPVIIMHMRGVPKTMQKNPVYNDVIEDIKQFFQQQIQAAELAGIKQIILDPGLGFGKTLEHNLAILHRLAEFKDLGKPLLVGPSRKSFLGGQVHDRLAGTLAAVAIAIYNGAYIVRVHDVKECKQALEVVYAVRRSTV